jgi:glycosyltransferase involved in cell wall biosynthesis
MQAGKNLRIAVYLRLLYGGGAERVMVNLIQGFIRKGVAVDLVLNTVSGPFLDSISAEVNIIDLNSPRMIQGLIPLMKYLKQEKPTALLSALHYANEIAILAKLLSGSQSKIFPTEHNVLSIHSKHRYTERFSPILAKVLYPFADGIITVSNGVAQDLASFIKLNPHQLHTIYNPVITGDIFNKSLEDVSHPWFRPGEPPVLLGIGRLTEQKNFSDLIRALSLLQHDQNMRLLILGSGEDKAKLMSLSEAVGVRDRIDFLGFINNPYPYIRNADLLVLSSLWEGLPTVLVESLALGTPVISTNCPHGPQEILKNGQYGVIVPMGDVEALATAISTQLKNPCLVQIPNAHLDKFKLDKVVDQYLDILGST